MKKWSVDAVGSITGPAREVDPSCEACIAGSPRRTLCLRPGDVVVFDSGASVDVRASVLDGTHPAPDVADDLLEFADDRGGPNHDEDVFDASVAVDGASWGWFETLDGWKLLPLDFQRRAEELANVTFAQVESMPVGVFWSGCRASGPIALRWYGDDSDGDSALHVQYDHSDDVALVLESVGWGANPLCPGCNDGCEFDFFVAENVGWDYVSELLGRFWEPCADHVDEVVEALDLEWQWREGSWRHAPS